MKTAGRFIIMTAALAVLAALPACTSADGADLFGTSWVLRQSGEQAAAGLVPIEVTLEFASDGTVQGVYGFNKYAGNYEVEDDAISFNTLCWTTMSCMAAGDTLGDEQAYLFALEDARSYAIDGNTLSIDTGDTVLVFTRG
jgi:heat shock protein HslJ